LFFLVKKSAQHQDLSIINNRIKSIVPINLAWTSDWLSLNLFG
jgi:hypothetical protein